MEFPERGRDIQDVRRELQDAAERDVRFSSGRIVASMCTEPLEIAREAHSMFIEANLGNSGLCPGTADLERRVISMLRDLLHGAAGSGGRVLSGGTESNICSLWIARNMTRKRKVVMGEHSHFSLEKGCDLLNLEKVVVPLDGEYRMDVDRVARHAEDACAIVTSAGTTELGAIDPIREISELCGETYVHVDAAFGGFVIPFLREMGHDLPDFDLSVPGVKGLTIDPHKMGMGTVPAGCLLVRDERMFGWIQFSSPYLTREVQDGILGTRASSSVAAAYAAMTHLGREGYIRIVRGCMEVTMHLLDGVERMGIEPVIRPIMNILSVRVKDPERAYRSLRKRGWLASVTRIPSLRFVVMPHMKMRHADLLLGDLRTLQKEGVL